MAAFVVCALAALILIKPQEFLPPLAGLPLVYVAFAASLAFLVLDVVWKRVRLELSPHTPWLVAFIGWALVTTAVKRPHALDVEALGLAILFGVYLCVSHGLASARGVRLFAATLVGVSLLVATVAIVQSSRPFTCFVAAADDWDGHGELTYDGRPCESVYDCARNAPIAGSNYRCERPGPLQTATIGGRVRYRGSLDDPNELSLLISVTLPLGLAMLRRESSGKDAAPAKRLVVLPALLSDRLLTRFGSALRSLPEMALIAVVGFTVVLSKSRSGLIVFLLVLGIQFVRHVGAWGLVAASIAGPPMILFGGRSGVEADSSSDERAELLREAFEFIKNTKGIGLGAGGFPDESSIGLTAHNAYVLAAAETGIVGMMLFGVALYLALKVPYAIWFGDYRVSPTIARFAPALAVSMTGVALGIFFLSWTYKDVLWLLFGFSAALYAAARAEDPRIRVGLTLREMVLVPAGTVALLIVAYGIARLTAPHH